METGICVNLKKDWCSELWQTGHVDIIAFRLIDESGVGGNSLVTNSTQRGYRRFVERTVDVFSSVGESRHIDSNLIGTSEIVG
jgi:hypothetical protein